MFIVWGVALVLVALPLVALLSGGFAASRWPVRSLSVDGAFAHVRADRVRAVLEPRLADGFFGVDPGELRRAVAELPWVARVEVRKRWPDQVEVRVHEQQAVARWNDAALINRHGELFRVPPEDDVLDLPHLVGPDARRADVLAFYVDLRARLAPIARRVEGVELSARGAWSARLDGGALLRIGREDAVGKLTRFIATYAQLTQGHARSFEYVDLRYPNGYAVRWPEALTGAQSGT